MDNRAELIALLDWYRELGIDAALSDDPVDWLARPDAGPGVTFARQLTSPERTATAAAEATVAQPPISAPLTSDVAPAQLAPPAPPRAATTPASQFAAQGAASLDALRAAIAAFDGCALQATAKNLCFYRGTPDARLMIIGEAPGREEDLEGRPFVGRAGQLLDKMLGAIGLNEADVHITNIVYWRPPGNRTPTAQEALACRPFLTRQLELVAPDVVVTLGGPAAKELFGTMEGIMRLRGKWREVVIGGRTVPAMAMLHPAYLLRTPAAKALAWRDLLELQSRLSTPAKQEA